MCIYTRTEPLWLCIRETEIQCEWSRRSLSLPCRQKDNQQLKGEWKSRTQTPALGYSWLQNCISSQSAVASTGTNTARKVHHFICEGPLTDPHESIAYPLIKRKIVCRASTSCLQDLVSSRRELGAWIFLPYPYTDSQKEKHLANGYIYFFV